MPATLARIAIFVGCHAALVGAAMTLASGQ